MNSRNRKTPTQKAAAARKKAAAKSETKKTPENFFPANEESGSTAENTSVEVASEVEQVATPQERPRRVPLHRQSQEFTPQREGYVRRWVRDGNRGHYANRVQKLEGAWYSIVQDPNIETVQVASDGTRRVLMEIEEKYYRADQEDKQKMNDANLVAATEDQEIPGQYGNITIVE